MRYLKLFSALCVALMASAQTWGQAESISFSGLSEGTPATSTPQLLLLDRVGRYGRAPVHIDPAEAAIIHNEWQTPHAGDTLRGADGEDHAWRAVTPTDDGWIRDDALFGGYISWQLNLDQSGVWLLHARGHSLVYVNGLPRAGDPYNTGWSVLPVWLREGDNELLFVVGRGQVWAELRSPDHTVGFNSRDLTLPTLIRGSTDQPWLGVPIYNTQREPARGLVVTAQYPDETQLQTPISTIPPLGMHKVGIQVPPAGETSAQELKVVLQLHTTAEPDAELLDELEVKLDVRDVHDRQSRTFISNIDNSVQYFAVTPAQPAEPDAEPPAGPLALFLTLHGAGVEARGQAAAYQPKTWGHVVAPTNRRPYGFDWEDWGRIDALEVLADARQIWDIDPQRIYLTGHSMGGHGVWQVGVQYTDRFAALGPSAAWSDFWAYAGAADYEDPTPIEQILKRATLPSRTRELSRNYADTGVYILHGGADDNVPTSLGRDMVKHLAEFHGDFTYYEQPGAGHWWGNQCVDWPPMFSFFKEHTLPDRAAVNHVEFCTGNPNVASRCHWVTIAQQQRSLVISRVDLTADREQCKIVGTTENVARLELDLACGLIEPADPLQLTLDDQTLADIAWPEDGQLNLEHADDTWHVAGPLAPQMKGPHRAGPFKAAFNHNFLLVYGTRGTADENAALFNQARYAAETFWYRGNGAPEMLPDTDFDPHDQPDRGVILYGNAETNAAWETLLADSPIKVYRGRVILAERSLTASNFACLLVRPRPGSDVALVAAIAGTSLEGQRLTERLPYFVSGVSYPDWIVIDTTALADGPTGVRAAGFFANDWSYKPTDSPFTGKPPKEPR